MFKKLQLREEILTGLSTFEYTQPTEVQERCIPEIIKGKDLIARSKTGTGKTLAFGLPLIQMVEDAYSKGVDSLVVCPTRELAQQVGDEIRKISNYVRGLRVCCVYGGADLQRQIVKIKKSKIIVGTPGRIVDHINRRTLKLEFLKTLVLDEADEMLKMGFKKEIETIISKTPKTRQTVMFSATMPKQIVALAKDYMTDPTKIEIGEDNSTLTQIAQNYLKTKQNGKKQALLDIFTNLQPKRVIIFSNTKRMTEDLQKFLNGSDLKSLALHGDKRQSERKRIMTKIKNHDVNILVATDVAARGIDINDVDLVINYDIPNELDFYIHRIGRTARAGKEGKAITLINTSAQFHNMKVIAKLTKSIIKKLVFQNGELVEVDDDEISNVKSLVMQDIRGKSREKRRDERMNGKNRESRKSNSRRENRNYKTREDKKPKDYKKKSNNDFDNKYRKNSDDFDNKYRKKSNNSDNKFKRKSSDSDNKFRRKSNDSDSRYKKKSFDDRFDRKPKANKSKGKKIVKISDVRYGLDGKPTDKFKKQTEKRKKYQEIAKLKETMDSPFTKKSNSDNKKSFDKKKSFGKKKSFDKKNGFDKKNSFGKSKFSNNKSNKYKSKKNS